MLGFLKSLLRKPQGTPAGGEQAYAQERLPAAPPPAAPNYNSGAPATAARRNAPNANGKGVEIPLQSIIEGLPLELQPRVKQTDVGDRTISVPLEKVLAQLSRGVVKVSFGELRQAASGVFSLENDRDRVLVPLPLAEILSRLNPALITRRRVQRQVRVPDEISSPFDSNGQNSDLNDGPEQQEEEAAPITPARHNLPVSSVSPPTSQIAPVAPSAPAAPAIPLSTRGSFSPSSAPTPPPAAAPADMVPRFTVAPPAPPSFAPQIPSASATPAPIPFSRIPPSAAPAPAAPPASAAAQPVRDHIARPQHAPTLPASVPQPAKAATGGEPLLVGLTGLAEGWPEAVRKEIIDLNLVEAKVALPFSAVEQALKQGRIAFSWKSVRSWVKPAMLPTNSAHDGAVLELPLKVVAPIFLARQKEHTKGQQKVSVDEEIPNLFFGFPQPESAAAAAAATARPTDTNYYVWDESADTARVNESEVKRGPTPGTKFVAKYATPNEVVSRTASLEGVAGALIALPDGLMVANRLPPEVNADTLAAFLPQIFGKVSQCTKELRMGELNNLNFTVGNVPWKIFRVNAIFFAAFGRAGEPLPTAQLASLAAELDHKPK